ncbi:hypothetical protein Peur_005101 [Populus x canadensis]
MLSIICSFILWQVKEKRIQMEAVRCSFKVLGCRPVAAVDKFKHILKGEWTSLYTKIKSSLLTNSNFFLALSSMARRVPSCDDNGGGCGRGGGEAPIPCSNIYLPSCSFVKQINNPSRIPCNYYYSKCDMVGDVFYGTDDYLDVKDLIHREDVLEH